MQAGSGTESIRVPGRVIDLGMWLVLLGKEESPSAPSDRGDEIWRARMRLALRVQDWCDDGAIASLVEATRLRLTAWAATVARVRSLAELQETTSELERGWAYIFDILGSATPVWHKAGYRLDEVVLWNAFADVLVALATVKRCTFGWTLQGSTKPLLQAMPEPGPTALSELAPANAHYRAMHEEWDALRPRLRAVTRRTLAA